MKKLILGIKNIQLSILKSNPPKLAITVMGVVPTSGWQNPELIEYVYVQPPPDGIYDFDFVAEEPQGKTMQVLTPILVSHIWEGVVEDIKGVRIHSSRGKIEQMMDGTKSVEFND